MTPDKDRLDWFTYCALESARMQNPNRQIYYLVTNNNKHNYQGKTRSLITVPIGNVIE